VVLHEILARICVHSEWVGFLIKGEARRIVTGGRPEAAMMRSRNISSGDLMEAVRLHGRTRTIADVQEAYLERNGQISVITKA
jgi:uncharacterized membrane protein YcaP (DUF421 family)